LHVAAADMRRNLIAGLMVDLLVPACSAAYRRLVIASRPVERVGHVARNTVANCLIGAGAKARAVLRPAGFFILWITASR
jgi:hypothetical protein